MKRLSREEAHAYWRNPNDGDNLPGDYIDYAKRPVLAERDKTLLHLFDYYVERSERILEIGCNAGRNLATLKSAGYEDLTAIEISEAAVATMQSMLPDVRNSVDIRIGSIEDRISDFPAMAFDTILSMAVMIHMPAESEYVFAEIASRAKRRLIIVEQETPTNSARHFPREYRPIFEAHGFKQVLEMHPVKGLPKSYFTRVFERT